MLHPIVSHDGSQGLAIGFGQVNATGLTAPHRSHLTFRTAVRASVEGTVQHCDYVELLIKQSTSAVLTAF
ncbi:protein of unknown function [Methylocaldum szegediense]|uniref:Uncharacterized protein n=1 Tax=Methylocaldum szegediense TaxID=73780 RepID=A0ABN8WZM0_9GAMM|nr:protein of unknown function [Methylocaldum szegediense]